MERRPTHILSSYYAPRGAHRMYALLSASAMNMLLNVSGGNQAK